ncbi:hypothetical protein PGB28_10210 [Primorskyibacter aestuariivivens]|uniref:hypothetical protein n=1 Tax=Primorskyibacter aestuariivivens TaxID=1888912 RepID=UPI00230139C2|nr:hypothetical protein [Primorskyibacter aestuariivivens]MDA7428834.1 hypothetical protein [Primorskyibacter aestuariivivens]
MISNGQLAFNQRVARINSGQVCRVPQPGVAENASHGWLSDAELARTVRSSVGAGLKDRLHALSYVWAFLLGVLSILLSRYTVYHLHGLPNEVPKQFAGMVGDIAMADLIMGVDVAIGGFILVAFALAFNLATREHMFCKFVGLWVATTMMHNLVHMYPEQWTTLFSWEWVDWVRSTTDPNSILFRGMSFKLT